MAAKFTVSVVMHLILLCLFVIWHVVFVALGFASMGQDADVSQVTPPAPPATPPSLILLVALFDQTLPNGYRAFVGAAAMASPAGPSFGTRQTIRFTDGNQVSLRNLRLLSMTHVYPMFSEENCGKQTHILKYTTMNTIFGAMVLVSYAVFPGGGEGARARAMVITIVHGGLLGWGMLMEAQNATCMSVIGDKFNLIYTFHQLSVYHNAAFFSFMFLHELYLGEKVNADLTLIPEVKSEHISSEYEYETAHLDHTGYENPNFAEGLRSLNAVEHNSPALPTTSGIESPNFEEEPLRTV